MTKESMVLDREKKILIIEDETLTAMMLESYIMERGFVSAGFYSTGEDAVAMALTEKPDLIFMDFRLSGKMDGIEAAKRIEEELHTPIVIISGYTEGVVFEHAAGYSPKAFLSKPLKFTEIDGILKSIA